MEHIKYMKDIYVSLLQPICATHNANIALYVATH
jgi:hypothetical protein